MVWSSGAFLRLMVAAGCWAPAKLTTDVKADGRANPGDTLTYTVVVTSNGTDERTWLDNAGNPHSDQLKVEERYHRVDGNSMELTVVIDDPKTYTRPWVGRDKLKLTLLPSSTDLMEMIPSASESAAVRSIYAAEAAAGKK